MVFFACTVVLELGSLFANLQFYHRRRFKQQKVDALYSIDTQATCCLLILRIFWPITMGVVTLYNRINYVGDNQEDKKINESHNQSMMTYIGIICSLEIIYCIFCLVVACLFYRRLAYKNVISSKYKEEFDEQVK